jgi:hypothetical protein
MHLVNIQSKATKKPSVDIVEVQNRKASKFQILQENNLFGLEIADDVTSHQ